MIKIYCDLDLKSQGCYGFRPLLDLSDTCYAKQHQILDNESDSLLVDHNFMDKLDSLSNCKMF
ncbi:hypothetical protein GQ55_5G443100 [Panicum hallii var. hallii]|uniref:Uncharacterized protein n=1 Tax=Panicum hallii var. hallii TaxID=1504633 RepID=A0A2T7DPR1_9POAL|nr:hypothetical protein GQ55_5G443100 [Panicum hallii var. hallii]